MLTDSNILLFLLAIVPGLLYTLIIFANSPKDQMVKLRLALQYLLYGTLSIFFVLAIHFIFPHWMEYIWTSVEPIFMEHNGIIFMTERVIPTNFSVIFRNFVQIGLTEEVCKALVFMLITGLRLKSFRVKDKPYAIMFYVMMVSMGFALVENIHYGWNFQSMAAYNPNTPQAEDVLMIRSITAIVAHMLFGLIMGFFFALGFKEIRGYNSKQTLFNIWGRVHSKLRKTIFFVGGILSATIFHGMYDYQLTIGSGWIATAELLILGLIITYFMSKELTRKS